MQKGPALVDKKNIAFDRVVGSKGWRSGESACLSHQCGPGSYPGVDAMWVEFVVGSLLCSERFFLRVLWFSPLLKNQHFQISI